ncbi:tyrosinase family protein [Aurantiacibacter sp. MUD61]|uniref:tyrosinase family protein n=1 Tax=Aurantiacibacter sp. MUD61 TaxID=3009083 RepID=UPI0022F055D0|nr:tyrosinase family protein [Aurantiacibacter sp. MUD61]
MSNTPFTIDRRGAMGSALAAGIALTLPGCADAEAEAETEELASTTATYTRYSVFSPEGQAQLATYAEAITAMLALPATDPRNWYRQAMIHLIDCPHGNWWFFNWHRPFLGYFEQICREVTGDQTFALPYWDWTANPELPPEFYGPTTAPNALDPTSSLFYADSATFMSNMDAAVDAFWNALTPAQQAKMSQRHGAMSLAELKSSMQSAYAGGASARGADAQAGQLDKDALAAVDIKVINTGLSATLFNAPNPPPRVMKQTIFNSAITENHSDSGKFAVIEGQPHNNVHNSIGGLMGEFLSPIDPIFWLHHANVDRLWTVWTAEQNARGQSPFPSSDEGQAFDTEEYLFFVQPDGRPVADDISAGLYMTPAAFDYTYGGGTQIMAESEAMVSMQDNGYILETTVSSQALRPGAPATASVQPREEAMVAGEETAITPQDGVANVVFTPVDGARHRYRLYLTGEGETPDLSLDGADYVGTFAFFGDPHAIEPTPITISLANWIAANGDRLSGPLVLHFDAVPENVETMELAVTPGSLNSASLQFF